MRKLFGAVLILGVLLATQIPGYAQRPAVDGFIGVPWGASKAQVQSAMAKKGFTPIKQGDELYDKYKGTFAGHPAELEFWYAENVFYHGEAALLDSRVPEKFGDVTLVTYQQMVRVFEAKYGPADVSYCGKEALFHQTPWVNELNNVPTTVTPPGKVNVGVYMRYCTYGPNYGTTSVIVTYDIGKSWALLKTGKGNDY